MASNKDIEVKVPLRLIINLVDCLEAQKNLSSSTIDNIGRHQMQKLIDNTKEWANEVIIENLNGERRPSTDLQETLDFVKTDRSSKLSVSACDTENESSCVMIVEPDDSEGGFL